MINAGTCNWDRCIVLAAETLRKQSHATGTGSVARSYKEAGITDAVSLGAVCQQPAHRGVVVQQDQADRGFKPAWIDRGLQFSRCAERAGLADLAFTELMPGE